MVQTTKEQKKIEKQLKLKKKRKIEKQQFLQKNSKLKLFSKISKSVICILSGWDSIISGEHEILVIRDLVTETQNRQEPQKSFSLSVF